MHENFVTIRYIVNDVAESLAFYTGVLSFTLQAQAGNAFASVTRGNIRLMLSNRTSAAAAAMPDGSAQAPGGWTRVVIVMHDLAGEVERMKASGVSFRNELQKGVGSSQILLADPSGNIVELFEPAEHPHNP